jgi:hypothetical protein
MSKEVRVEKQKDGPLPEHYEPVESPINNPSGNQQSNPLAVKYKVNSPVERRSLNKGKTLSFSYFLLNP